MAARRTAVQCGVMRPGVVLGRRYRAPGNEAVLSDVQEPALALARPTGMTWYRRLATACVLVAVLTLALGCAQDATNDPTPSQAVGWDERVTSVYTTWLRYHIADGLPLDQDQWSGVLYLSSATRADAINPLEDYLQPGDQRVSEQVQENVGRDLADVAEVRWIDDPGEAGLTPLNRECHRHDRQTTPVLVWLPSVSEGTRVELGISTWAGCGLASGSTYVVSESDGSWTASPGVRMWIT